MYSLFILVVFFILLIFIGVILCSNIKVKFKGGAENDKKDEKDEKGEKGEEGKEGEDPLVTQLKLQMAERMEQAHAYFNQQKEELEKLQSELKARNVQINEFQSERESIIQRNKEALQKINLENRDLDTKLYDVTQSLIGERSTNQEFNQERAKLERQLANKETECKESIAKEREDYEKRLDERDIENKELLDKNRKLQHLELMRDDIIATRQEDTERSHRLYNLEKLNGIYFGIIKQFESRINELNC